jgi:hypothetical protein
MSKKTYKVNYLVRGYLSQLQTEINLIDIIRLINLKFSNLISFARPHFAFLSFFTFFC